MSQAFPPRAYFLSGASGLISIKFIDISSGAVERKMKTMMSVVSNIIKYAIQQIVNVIFSALLPAESLGNRTTARMIQQHYGEIGFATSRVLNVYIRNDRSS